MTEIWRDIVGYEGFYQVSNYGRVKRLAGYKNRSDGLVWWHKERIFTGRGKRLYKRAELFKDGKGEEFYIHRLVAFEFIPIIEGKNYINHIDGDPSNNHVSNLEWCTLAENNEHARLTGLNKIGHKVKLTRLSDGKVFFFPDKRAASYFLGKNHTAVGYAIRKGILAKCKDKVQYHAEVV